METRNDRMHQQGALVDALHPLTIGEKSFRCVTEMTHIGHCASRGINDRGRLSSGLSAAARAYRGHGKAREGLLRSDARLGIL